MAGSLKTDFCVCWSPWRRIRLSALRSGDALYSFTNGQSARFQQIDKLILSVAARAPARSNAGQGCRLAGERF